MDGGAMGQGITPADRYDLGHPFRRDRAHRNDHATREGAGRPGVDRGPVHGNRPIRFYMIEPQTRFDERALEGEGAAEREGDEILPPKIHEIRPGLDQRAMMIDVIGGDVPPHIDVAAERAEQRIAGIGDANQRTRFGVALAVTHEVQTVLGRQDHQIGLEPATSEPSGMALIAVAPDHGAHVPGIGQRC